MPHKNKADHDRSMKRVHDANHELLVQAKKLFGIPLDKRRKAKHE
jgi:hypothetical protein